MKRLYVRPAARGEDLGRRLLVQLVAHAAATGYARMLLDTLAPMKSAQRLYATLGFREIGAYYHNPVPGTVYLALELPRSANVPKIDAMHCTVRGAWLRTGNSFKFTKESSHGAHESSSGRRTQPALKIVERDIPEPGPRQVRVKVEVCGVCHSDMFTVAGAWPGIQYPRVPGHEVVGMIDALGKDVPEWKTGMRVGVGWHGGHCGHCARCRRGDFVTCVNGQVPGISYDGGYSEYMIAPFETLAAVPDSLKSAEAAPLLCAGITTFNALRHSGAQAGDLVAVLGMGGLGHLAVQYAAHMGFNTVAIARGMDKAPFAKKLGAAHYIDSTSQDVAKELSKLGGAALVLATVTDAKSMAATIGGLGVDRQTAGARRLSRSHRSVTADADRPTALDRRLALGHLGRFRGHAEIQRVVGYQADDRDFSARPGRRGPTRA